MNFLKRPFRFGNIDLSSNIFCAPLAGCSDWPFRVMTGSYRPGLFFCEMVKIDALVRHDPHTYRYLDYTPDMHPIGAQLCGSKPKMAADAARIVEDLGFDVIDLNCGCPVDKVTKDGSGSGLLRNPQRIGEILSAIINAVRVPVTVKIRAGWNDQQINAVEILRIAEQAGAVAITVHGRTREQAYKGPADWSYIRDCKQAAKHILVIGNGDVFDADSAERMFEQTGCDGVLLARGTLGRPWLIDDIYHKGLNLPPVHRTVADIKTALLSHLEWIDHYQSERQALMDMRRVSAWYLKPCIGAKPLRIQLNQAVRMKDVFDFLNAFDWNVIHFSSDQEANFVE